MTINTIIFDMDGVLIDARDWHYNALNDALELFGYTINREDHLRAFDGLPTRTKLETLSDEQGLPRGLHPFINEMKQAFTVRTVHVDCRPTFAHEYMLSRLRESGYKLGVASNSIRASIDLMLSKANLIDFFDEIVSNEDVTDGKPSPEIYIEAMRRLDASPSSTLVVEDNAHGVQAAQAAGAHVLEVRTPADVHLRAVTSAIASLP
jgi:beta-phosphoglucomutase